MNYASKRRISENARKRQLLEKLKRAHDAMRRVLDHGDVELPAMESVLNADYEELDRGYAFHELSGHIQNVLHNAGLNDRKSVEKAFQKGAPKLRGLGVGRAATIIEWLKKPDLTE